MRGRLIVIGATSDNLVRHSTGSETLAAKLEPSEYLVLESGHAVNVERAAEVNEAMLRLFAHVDTLPPPPPPPPRNGGGGARHSANRADDDDDDDKDGDKSDDGGGVIGGGGGNRATERARL